jgi:hypothetical protein
MLSSTVNDTRTIGGTNHAGSDASPDALPPPRCSAEPVFSGQLLTYYDTRLYPLPSIFFNLVGDGLAELSRGACLDRAYAEMPCVCCLWPSWMD